MNNRTLRLVAMACLLTFTMAIFSGCGSKHPKTKRTKMSTNFMSW